MAEVDEGVTDEDAQPIRRGVGWWLAQLLLTATAGFFVWFGVALLVGAYGLADPFSFIMTVFAACLIILFSLVMVLGFSMRMWRAVRNGPPPGKAQTDA